LIHPIEVLSRRWGKDALTLFFYNPNVHPFLEFKARLQATREYAAELHLPLVEDATYALDKFLAAVAHNVESRCPVCYRMRLQRTGLKAAELGCDGFSTSLLVSPYQQHETIKSLGQIVAQETGVPFIYDDFRTGYREANARSRRMSYYRQKYCGCIYSERDRYQPKGSTT
jgi:hypothetical protein